jgi:hypothetical protein
MPKTKTESASQISYAEAVRLLRIKVRKLTHEEKAALKTHPISKLPRERNEANG